MWTLADTILALAPQARVPSAERVRVAGACVDSRLVGPNELFVALCGERVDGHSYVVSAFQNGAVAALVERPVDGVQILDTRGDRWPMALCGPVAILVPNTLQALQRLAGVRRSRQPELRVIGVTGSVGKTTAKEVIAAVLEQRYRTLRSEGNYNNEIGLPLTLMGLADEHQHAVLEMGMYDVGEIAQLCQIAKPDIGVVTNVGPVHLERLGTMERIAQAKAELVEALPEEGLAVLNGDDPRVRAMASRTKARSITFGLGHGNVLQARDIVAHGLRGVTFRPFLADPSWGPLPDASCTLHLSAIGRHAVLAALTAVAVGLTEGFTWDEIARGLLVQGQGPRLIPRRGMGESILLDDTYNASPVSVLAALDVLADLPGRRLAVLGDMLELGSYEEQGHTQVGQRCAEVLDGLVAVGQRARRIAEAAMESGMASSAVWVATDNAAAVEIIAGLLRKGDTLLVKGSRGMAMEGIVQALAEDPL